MKTPEPPAPPGFKRIKIEMAELPKPDLQLAADVLQFACERTDQVGAHLALLTAANALCKSEAFTKAVSEYIAVHNRGSWP